MKDKRQEPLPQDKDRHLDVPAEAARDKHINFLDDSDEAAADNREDDKATRERQKQWQQGLEEGRQAREGD